MHTYAVIDFETTGLSPQTDRIIEVAVVLVRDHQVADTFSELMDPGFRIPGFITGLTGISTAMVRGKPSPEKLMPKVQQFIGTHPCVAHNASFDSNFFAAEMRRAGVRCQPRFLCSMLLARRLVQDSANHQLGTLVQHLRLSKPAGMRAHRALADSLMTVELWKCLMERIESRVPGYVPDEDFVARLCRAPKAGVDALLNRSAVQRQGSVGR